MSKPLRTRLGHFRIKVRKCSVDTSEVLFGGVQRTLPNLYSEVSYAMTFLFNPVSCRFHWLISSFSCSQMILHIYLITVCTYFEPGRPWADIIQEINKKSKNSNFLLFTKWLPALDWFTAWITLGIGLCGHFRIKVRKCPEPLPWAGNSTSNWAVQNAQIMTFLWTTLSTYNCNLFINNTTCPDWYLNWGPLDLQSNTLPLCHQGCWHPTLITLGI